MIRIGQGFDVHQLVTGRKMILGGVLIPYELGLLGHSDADVLVHALMDGLLGAIGAGDIGKHFPDHDAQYRNADSMMLLQQVMGLVEAAGFSVVNVDATVIAQRPKMAGYIPAMRETLAQALKIAPAQVNVKATTTEKLGFTGRGEGIAAMAVVLLENARHFKIGRRNEA
jgi:2-C-methyl-D-erythritol 2,4-cyclodiphosphate synthase